MIIHTLKKVTLIFVSMTYLNYPTVGYERGTLLLKPLENKGLF